MLKIISKLEEEIKELFSSESTGHDINHLKRVLNLALYIQKREKGDREIVAISSFLHDVHRIIEKDIGKYCHPRDSLPTIKNLLKKLNLPNEKIKKVLHCVEFHEEYNFSKEGKTARDTETLIVQDADNLDAMGAVGIARTFTFGGAYNMSIWTPELSFSKEAYDESSPEPSQIHHFYSKLLKLKDNMNTETAKRIALRRHQFMESFLKEFFEEWKGIR